MPRARALEVGGEPRLVERPQHLALGGDALVRLDVARRAAGAARSAGRTGAAGSGSRSRARRRTRRRHERGRHAAALEQRIGRDRRADADHVDARVGPALAREQGEDPGDARVGRARRPRTGACRRAAAVRRAADDVREGAAPVDPELPAAPLPHALRIAGRGVNLPELCEGAAREPLAGVAVADVDGAAEALPVEQIERFERRRDQRGRSGCAARGRGGAVDHAGAPQDLQDVRAPLPPRPREQLPERGCLRRLDVRRERAVRADVDADHRAAALRAHHVDRQVVHRAAVDEHLAALEHGRQHAGDRDRGAQPAPQRALLVHGDAAGGEVRGHAEEGQRQVLDVDVAELAAQQHADLAAGHQRHERQRVVRERIGVDEGALEALHQLVVAQSEATPAARMPPMLVPPTRSIGTPCSRSARTTPMCAKPRAPPPESTSPTARPVSEAHHAVVVRRPPHVVVRDAGKTGEPARRRAVHEGASRAAAGARRWRMPPSSHCARRPAGVVARRVRRSSTTSAWRRHSRVHGVSPGSAV